tara:strand:- start:302 stop:1492 length:1191 start_codon:yes stop_codon:yes gene_type:complete
MVDFLSLKAAISGKILSRFDYKRLMNKKILIVVNSLEFFLSHRNTLAQELIKNGYEVVVITDMNGKQYYDENIKFVDFAIDRASINPFSFFFKVIKLRKYLSIYQCDIYYFVSHKSNILGGFASFFQLNKLTIFSISGLGYAFINNNFLARILKSLILWIYSILAKKDNSLFVFQNHDDKKLFLDHIVLKEKQTTIIPGMGVDLKKFKFQQRESIETKPIKVLFAGRLLIDKGIQEFIALALKLKNKNFEFHISGKLDIENPNAVNPDYFSKCLKESNIVYHGHTQFEQMLALYSATDIFLLPSYREGFPKAALEAAATGQPLLMSDVPGCRDCIEEGFNGFLFKKGSIDEMESYLEKISALNNYQYFSINSRQYVESNFSATHIANQYINLIKSY